MSSIKGTDKDINIKSYDSILLHHNRAIAHDDTDENCLCVTVGNYTQGELVLKDRPYVTQTNGHVLQYNSSNLCSMTPIRPSEGNAAGDVLLYT